MSDGLRTERLLRCVIMLLECLPRHWTRVAGFTRLHHRLQFALVRHALFFAAELKLV